jgi:hypothetical protein
MVVLGSVEEIGKSFNNAKLIICGCSVREGQYSFPSNKKAVEDLELHLSVE